MREDAFSKYHPLVNFLYFVGAIGFGVVIKHPLYIAAGAVGAASYYLLLKGRKGLRIFAWILPMFVLISIINPIFNTMGERVLFMLFGRPYTFEALLYGMATGGMFAVMMLWFGCYNAVLTSDKFTGLFGNLIPSLSLLLVMVLRMIPALMRKAKQLTSARRSIGRGTGEGASLKERLTGGMTVLSALADNALEGSVTTADSMKSRGYGTAKRTNYGSRRMKLRDVALLIFAAALAAAAIIFADTSAEFVPEIVLAPINWTFAFYCVFVMIPTVLHLKEMLSWHISVSRI